MLSVECVIESSANIRALFPKGSPDQHQAWAQTIVAGCGWMQPMHFHEVCKAFLSEMTPGRAVGPKNLIAVYHKLKQERGWDRQEVKCGDCDGKRFVYTRLQHRETGEEIVAMKPCPNCRGTAEVKPDWIELPLETKTELEKWHALSPSGKQAALDYAEGLCKVIRKPDYLGNFVERMSKNLPPAASSSDVPPPGEFV